MSWHERYQKGAFRGIGFYLDNNAEKGGKRLSVHEYPYQSTPYIEDLGALPGKFTINAYVIGADYDRQRDALQAALEAKGKGNLTHPTKGMVDVFVSEYNITESTQQGGMAKFEISFIRAESQSLPTLRVDTKDAVDRAAHALDETAKTGFIDTWPSTLPLESAQKIGAAVEESLTDIERVVGNVVDPILQLINTPTNMAIAIVGTLNTVAAKFKQPADALATYETLFGAGGRLRTPPVGLTTQVREAQAARSLFTLMNSAALSAAARLAIQAPYPTADSALQTMSMINAVIESQQADALAEVDYYALIDLKGALVQDLTLRAAQLPKIDYIQNTAMRPALVIAYDLGGIAKEQELIDRNAIMHPNLVPAGTLEVLNDV